MARSRFDDVGYRIVEDPARPHPRGRRRALGGAAALVVAAVLAAAAAAPARRPDVAVRGWHNTPHMHYGAAGLPPTGASRSDVARAERFKENLLYGRILRAAARTATR